MIINRRLPPPPPPKNQDERVRNAFYNAIEEDYLEREREFRRSPAWKVITALLISTAIGLLTAVVGLILRLTQ